MKILWLTWKDKTNPLAGGAEVISSEIGKRLAKEGHEVIFLTAGFAGAEAETKLDGYKVIRVGTRLSVYWRAYRYAKQNLLDWPDLVVEEINTIPFLSRFYFRRKPRLLFFHQLARQIWFYQMIFPFSLVGYVLEPVYLRLLAGDKTIAMSASTKKDLRLYGFRGRKVHVISEAIHLKPVKSLSKIKKFDQLTLLSLGSLRAMKRTLHQLEAYELAKRSLPDLRLKIAGDSEGKYGQKVLERIKQSPYAEDIEYLGRPDEQNKKILMQRSHLILVTSVKEGWGLVVTEAASQGTPAIVYNVDGLRDSVQHGKTGLITKPRPSALAVGVVSVLNDRKYYQDLRKAAWNWSHEFTFEHCFSDFKEVAGLR